MAELLFRLRQLLGPFLDLLFEILVQIAQLSGRPGQIEIGGLQFAGLVLEGLIGLNALVIEDHHRRH